MSGPDTPAAPAEAPEAARKAPNLPKRRPLSTVRLPKKRTDPVLPRLEGRKLKCPYCGGAVEWPPPGLKCPSCSRVLRPPPGFAPKDMALRRAAKEKIAEARDRALAEIGPRVGGEGANKTGWLVAALFMLMLGAGLVAASRRAAPVSRPSRDNAAWTTNVLDVAAMALHHYSIDTGHYPTLREGGLAALSANPGAPGWNGPYLSNFGNDGWNRPFSYVPAPPAEDGAAAAATPDLRSAGEDRLFGTGDDLAAAPEQFRAHPDFVPNDRGRPADSAPVSVVIDPAWVE